MEVLNKFSINEAFNSSYYGDWNIEEFDPFGVGNYISAYITEGNPEKKIILKRKAGVSDDDYEATDYFVIALNDETAAPKLIYIDMEALPFTVDGLLVTKFSFNLISGSGGGDSSKDLLELISYH